MPWGRLTVTLAEFHKMCFCVWISCSNNGNESIYLHNSFSSRISVGWCHKLFMILSLNLRTSLLFHLMITWWSFRPCFWVSQPHFCLCLWIYSWHSCNWRDTCQPWCSQGCPAQDCRASASALQVGFWCHACYRPVELYLHPEPLFHLHLWSG